MVTPYIACSYVQYLCFKISTVYLRADPETCYERLKKRSRKEEAGVPIVSIVFESFNYNACCNPFLHNFF